MPTQFIKNFNPQKLSNEELVSIVKKVTPQIIHLPNEEQVLYWEFIGANLSQEQYEFLTISISKYLITDSQRQNYSHGIIGLSYDIEEIEQSLNKLKEIESPDKFIQSAISSMENLKTELANKYKKHNKKN